MPKRSKPKPSFNEILLASIDEALSSLGESVATSVYFHVEKTFNVKRGEIPQRINDFSDALEKIFGLGGKTLKIMFMKKLRGKVEVTCKWSVHEEPLCKLALPEATFQEYVRLMRQNYESSRGKELKMRVFINEYERLQE